jgi:hypothetical protein
MELLGVASQVKDPFDLVGDSVNLSEIGTRFGPNVPWPCESFCAYAMELLGNMGETEVRFGLFGGSVNPDTR